MTAVVASHIRRNTSAEARSSSCPLTVEQLAHETHTVLANCGVAMSRSKVSRLVRTYKHRVGANGFPFVAWLVNNVDLDAMHRRIVADELTKVIAYADPTGETASRNVDRERRASR